MLGYRDSGMAGSEANANPDCFAAAPLDEATGRLVAVIRRTRPQVMVIYGDDQTGYPHPDHLRVHDAGLAAFRAAGDPGRFPGAGPGLPAGQALLHGPLGGPVPGHPRQVRGAGPGVAVRRRVAGPVGHDARRGADHRGRHHRPHRRAPRALLAHATQVDPKSKFWFGLPPEVMGTIQPHDDYRLALVGDAGRHGRPPARDGVVETDLFAGIDGGLPGDGPVAVRRVGRRRPAPRPPSLPGRRRWTGTVEVDVTGGPDGRRAGPRDLRRGAPGRPAAPGPPRGPDATLTLTDADARAGGGG